MVSVGSDLLAVLDQLAEILDRLSLRYVVGGSLASGAWGEPRSSHDADLLIELPRERVQDLHAALERTFYADESEILTAVSEKRAFNVIHLGLYHKVDLFVAGAGALDVAQFEGAVARNLGDGSNRTYPVTSAEVIVLRKLVGESSDRQWRDVQAVLRTQGRRLDLDRMNPLARSEGLSNLLQRAIDEAWGSGSS